jgi:hypothetical protein
MISEDSGIAISTYTYPATIEDPYHFTVYECRMPSGRVDRIHATPAPHQATVKNYNARIE